MILQLFQGKISVSSKLGHRSNDFLQKIVQRTPCYLSWRHESRLATPIEKNPDRAIFNQHRYIKTKFLQFVKTVIGVNCCNITRSVDKIDLKSGSESAWRHRSETRRTELRCLSFKVVTRTLCLKLDDEKFLLRSSKLIFFFHCWGLRSFQEDFSRWAGFSRFSTTTY